MLNEGRGDENEPGESEILLVAPKNRRSSGDPGLREEEMKIDDLEEERKGGGRREVSSRRKGGRSEAASFATTS